MTPDFKPLAQLCQELANAKIVEAAATDARVAIEEQIVAQLGHPDEGSKTHTIDGAYKVTISGKKNRTMDWDAWESVKATIPINMHPVKLKPVLDERGCRYLQLNEPETYAKLPLTVKQGKTAVEVKEAK